MSTTIKLSVELIDAAKRYAMVYSRSTATQIEHWSRIGKTVEENPDLPYQLIKDILLAQQEAEQGEVTPFEFGL